MPDLPAFVVSRERKVFNPVPCSAGLLLSARAPDNTVGGGLWDERQEQAKQCYVQQETQKAVMRKGTCPGGVDDNKMLRKGGLGHHGYQRN